MTLSRTCSAPLTAPQKSVSAPTPLRCSQQLIRSCLAIRLRTCGHWCILITWRKPYCDKALFVLLTYNQCIHSVQTFYIFVLKAHMVDTAQLLGYNQSEMSVLNQSVYIPE